MTGTLVYLDSSAIVKLVVREPESAVLFEWLATRAERVSSVVARVEVPRALRRTGAAPGVRRRAEDVLDRLALLPLERSIVDTAAALDPPRMRALDALHLATALALGSDLAGIVTYDERLAAAARRSDVEVWAPR